MNIGYIYKITNNINGKCYIGQTSKTIGERWRLHINDSKRKNRSTYNYPLYKAFRKYGIENFTVKEIEKCSINKLNEREIYWIEFYNAYKNGYNQDMGGSGRRILNLNEVEVIEKYVEIQSVIQVSRHFNCATDTIRNILNKHNVKIKSIEEYLNEKKIIVYQLNDNKEIINAYNTLTDAGHAMYDLGLTKAHRDDAYKIIREAILMGSKTCGYYWSSPNYTAEDKAKHKENKNNVRRKRYAERVALGCAPNCKTKSCAICGTPIYRGTQLCRKCSDKNKKSHLLDELQDRGITREFLKSEIRTKTFVDIGKECNVTDNSIRAWCKKYNLPFRTTDIKKLTDEEWDKI